MSYRDGCSSIMKCGRTVDNEWHSSVELNDIMGEAGGVNVGRQRRDAVERCQIKWKQSVQDGEQV